MHIEKGIYGPYLNIEKCKFGDCSFGTLLKSRLKSHIDEEHEGIVRFVCDFMNCSFTTNDKSIKDRHIRNTHEGNFWFKCEYLVCKYGTQKKKALESHLDRHTSEKAYKCHLCEKTFAAKKKCSFDAHVKRHSGVKEFKCHTCGQAFSQIGFRNRHIRSIHEEVGKVKCDQPNCTRKTQKNCTSAAHIRIFKCKSCEKTFSARANRNEHIKITHENANEKVVKCDICDKTFTGKGHKDRHINYVHEGIRPFKCDQLNCNYGTQDRRSLKFHKINNQCYMRTGKKGSEWKIQKGKIRPTSNS